MTIYDQSDLWWPEWSARALDLLLTYTLSSSELPGVRIRPVSACSCRCYRGANAVSKAPREQVPRIYASAATSEKRRSFRTVGLILLE